jgi:hypothetical protein
MSIELPLTRRALDSCRLVLLVVGLSPLFPMLGQEPAGAGAKNPALPDSPQPKQQSAQSGSAGATSKFVGYISNRSIFFPDIATAEGPLAAGRKFELFVDQSISPAYVLAAGVSAAINQARNVPRSDGQGWDAYGKRYGEDIARASSDSFFSTFLFASVLRQDPRFFPQSNPTFWDSVKYSAKRVFVTPTDSGGSAFNASGLLGPLASETLACAYLPRSEQTGAATAERYGTDLAWRFAGNMFKNYWPKFFRSLGLNRLKVVPDPGSTGGSAPRPSD